jgi:hypothetical protein
MRAKLHKKYEKNAFFAKKILWDEIIDVTLHPLKKALVPSSIG